MSMQTKFEHLDEIPSHRRAVAASSGVPINPLLASNARLSWWILTGRGNKLAQALVVMETFDPVAHGVAGEAAGSVRRGTSAVLKRALDVGIALVALVLLAPLIVAATVAIALLDGWPVHYGHRRVGRNGRAFHCYKFRTMVRDADGRLAAVLARDPEKAAEWAATQKLLDDPRVTTLGRVLRATSIDELPQLLNVLRGDMSCVGPRPVTADELGKHYGRHAADYLRVRPGITGLWQVSGRNALGYEARVALDVLYAKRRSLLLDLVIIARTLPALCRVRQSS